MRYRASLLIHAGQTQADPDRVILPLEYGYIVEVEIMFPAGQVGLTYVQLFHLSRQIFPLTPGSAFRGDDHTISMTSRFPILEVPFHVVVVGWAPDATLDHTVFVDVTMEAPPPIRVEGFAFVPLPGGM